MKNVIQVTRLHLEILYQLKTNSFMNDVKLNGSKFRLKGELNNESHRYNLIQLFKYQAPLFFNIFPDSVIKSSIIDIIQDTHKNNRKKVKIYKLSNTKIDEFIKINQIEI